MSQPDENVMRFPDITHQIEITYNDTPGFLIEKLDEAVAECARLSQKYQTDTDLSLTIRFTGSGDRMVIKAKLTTKLPNPESFPITAFVDRHGRLCKEDPAQTKLPINITRGGAE